MATATDTRKWANVDAGPRQVKDLNKAISDLRWEGKTRDELTGVVGGKEDRWSSVNMFGPVRPEVTELEAAIFDKYDGKITRANVRDIIADFEAAMPKARESRPVDDNRRTPEEEAERNAASAARDAEYKAKHDAEATLLAQVMAKAPAWAKALIIAEYHADASDIQTDYFASHTMRTVAIGFRSGSREDFRQLRAAAGQFPETAHMASEEALAAWVAENGYPRYHADGLEHRDNHSMGAGNYLSDHGWAGSGTGWLIKSRDFPCAYVTLTEDAIPAKPAAPEPAGEPGRPRGRAISGDVMDILSRATTEGNALRMTDRLDRDTYLAVNRVLDAAGGKWDRKARAHLFPSDAAPILAELLAGGTYRTAADDGWFPTPPEIVARILDAADLQPGLAVLEPSAGEGAIAGAAASRGCVVDCIELDAKRAAVMEQAGYARRVKVADFLDIESEPVYDRVLMNPPFAAKADVRHVSHALRFLKPGGLLVSVMSAGAQFREDRLTASLRETVEDMGGSLWTLPDRAFHESGTDVRTVLVVIPAPAAEAGQATAEPEPEPEHATAAVRALIAERADSYASDALRFREAAKADSAVMSADECLRFAAIYQAVADELRKIRKDIPLR